MKLLKELFKIYGKLLPPNEARIIIAHCLDISLEKLLLSQDRELNHEQLQKIQELVDRRKNNEPTAYLIGKKEFYGYEFEVSQDVLIPRPETEIIVDEAIKFLNDITKEPHNECQYFHPDLVSGPTSTHEDPEYRRSRMKYSNEATTNPPKFLDLCTGSGCIAVAISNETGANGLCTDISNKALTIAKKNITNHNLVAKIEARISNWFENLDQDEKFDLITCNPPYIAFSESNIMAKETIEFEPKLALFSGVSGYETYEIIARNARKHLNNHGQIILECGIEQSTKIIRIFESQHFKLVNVIKDLSSIERVLVFR